MRVGVIGAGLSGLAAARELRARGHEVVVIEKSRGVGGRLAARRIGGTVVDHGAPIIETSPASALAEAVATLAIDDQVTLDEGIAFRAGATRLAKALAHDLDIILGVRIAALRATRRGGFELAAEQGNSHGEVDAVIVSAPAPQTADLLEASREAGERVAALRAVAYDPAIMILAGLRIRPPSTLDPFPVAPPFVRVNVETVKGREAGDGTVPVVARVEPAASVGYLELSDDEILSRLTPILTEACGASAAPEWAQVKRWRFATCRKPGVDTAINPPGSRIVVCGDTLAGVSFDGVFASGLAAAKLLVG